MTCRIPALGIFGIVAILALQSPAECGSIGSDDTTAQIEVAPGLAVPADIWEDDYVPTFLELITAGFAIDDAEVLSQRNCTWGQIKQCFIGQYNECCPKKPAEGDPPE